MSASAATAGIATRPSAGAAAALLRRAVTDRITLAVVVGSLMVAMGAMVGALWPPLQDTFAELQAELPESLAALYGGADLGTATGWTTAELLSIVAPGAAIAVAAISAGRATAGEEESGTLATVLSAPVRRSWVLLAKAAAMAVHVLVVSALLAAGLVVAGVIGDMGLSAAGILGASLHVAAVGLLFGCVALLAGALTGRRRVTSAITGLLAVAAYITAALLPLVDSLAGAEKLSPWFYYGDSAPLANGADGSHLLILAATSAIVLVLAIAAFARRDLRG